MCDWTYILHYTRAWFPIAGANNCEGGVKSGGESSLSLLLIDHPTLPAAHPAVRARNRTLTARE